MTYFSEHIVATATEERPKEPDGKMEQATIVGHYGEGVGPSRSFWSERDLPFNQPNLYAPNSHTGKCKGYEIFPGEWDDFYLYGRNERLNREPPGIYNHSAALGFHNGHHSFSHVTPSLSVVGSDAPLYPPQLYPCSGADYTSSFSASGRGRLSRSPGGIRFQDQLCGHKGFRSSGLCSDWLKSSDRHRPLIPASQQPIQFCGFSSASISNNDSIYVQGVNQINHPENDGYSFGTNGGGWHGLHYGRHGMGNGSFCSCCSASDTLNEQNRGPRTSKPRRQIFTERIDSKKNTSSPVRTISIGASNMVSGPAPPMETKNLILHMLKQRKSYPAIASSSFSRWAPFLCLPLDGKRSIGDLQVNASAQFCGVAEMVGPVDFEKSVDYWQQDKWSGQFPVKWHIVKDVPNSQFRHIVLENNDNKPVTNSRDTQEVKLEKGVEMLNIFRNYEANISILDDFDCYDNRQRATQEQKSRDHSNSSGIGIGGGTEQTNVAIMHNKFIENMSKSFSQVVQLKDCSKDTSIPGRHGLRPDVPMSSHEKAGGAKNCSFARPISKLGYF